MCEDENVRYWMAISQTRGVGSRTTRRLIDNFKKPRNIFKASYGEIAKVSGIKDDTARNIVNYDNWAEVDREIKIAKKLNISILSWEDDRYPENLLQIHDPPVVIYVYGELEPRDELAVAIVGPRSPSSYGKDMARLFAERLASAGITIISGLARGVDTEAHRGALKAGGRTIAVMGSGLDVLYPQENKSLFEHIGNCGAVISEFPLGTLPDAVNFPKRNRIISGLSHGVLVAEASLKSGSLITARCAIDQNRNVYAIPGNVNSLRSKGTNSLIKDGARLVENPEEIILDILPQYRQAPYAGKEKKEEKMLSLDGNEDKVFSLLQMKPLHIDELTKSCMMGAQEVSTILLNLELMGVVKQHPGKLFSKI